MSFKKGRKLRSMDHASLGIVNGADIGQFGEAHPDNDVELLAACVELAEVALEIINKRGGFLQRVAVFLGEDAFAIVADLLLQQSRIIEAIYHLLSDEGPSLPSLFDAVFDRIGDAAFIVFDFDAEEASPRINEKVTL